MNLIDIENIVSKVSSDGYVEVSFSANEADIIKMICHELHIGLISEERDNFIFTAKDIQQILTFLGKL